MAPAQTLVSNNSLCLPNSEGSFVILHQLEEEDFITDRKSLSVSLRAKLGDFLKINGTDVEDRGTVKSISFDGNIELVTDNGVRAVQCDNIYILTYTTAYDYCVSSEPNENTAWFCFQ